ncbi:VC0807 family protein [Streptomyces sp. NPDC001339]|uniref:VC0807 family protein n=1 Tax=Streptomyces sp. NPDC001339 TaxID=3364563 RepID=UPI0036A7CB82
MTQPDLWNTSPAQTHRKAPRYPRLALAWMMLVDVGVPLALFYILREQGMGLVGASLVSSIPPALRTVYLLFKEKRVDVVGIFMLTLFGLGTALALLSGDARLVFAKDGWLTGAFGVWMLVTLMMKRPFFLHAGKNIALAKVGHEGAATWEARWDQEAPFRRGLRTLTAIFGVALLGDAVIRVAIAYMLPLDSIPLVTNVQYFILMGILWLFLAVYSKKHNLRA